MKLVALLVSALLFAIGPCAAQDWAKSKLEKSPRHSEWVTVENGSRKVKCFVAYPETKNRATAVLVIHEIFGLSDWVRLVADQLAAAGYLAIAPDLLSGTAPGGGGTSEFGGDDAVRKAVSSLPPQQITGDLNAASQYICKVPSANGKMAVTGFCWGGGQAFRYATNKKNLKASFVFYGPAPDNEADLKRIPCPVYGFYGENDARINTGIPKTTELMKKLGKTYEPVIYAGAGHAFLRSGEAPDATEANKKARVAAWKRLINLLSKL